MIIRDEHAPVARLRATAAADDARLRPIARSQAMLVTHVVVDEHHEDGVLHRYTSCPCVGKMATTNGVVIMSKARRDERVDAFGICTFGDTLSIASLDSQLVVLLKSKDYDVRCEGTASSSPLRTRSQKGVRMEKMSKDCVCCGVSDGKETSDMLQRPDAHRAGDRMSCVSGAT